MARRFLLPVSIVLLFFVAWWVGYGLIGSMGQNENNRPQSQIQNVETLPAQPLDTVSNFEGSSDATQLQAPDLLPAQTSKKLNFQYSGWKIDDLDGTVKACLKFNQEIALKLGGNDLIFTDYIKTSPIAKLQANIDGKQVCLSGLKFAKEYQLTILAGLPSKSGKKLVQDKTIEISFGNKPAHVQFAGNGVILPRLGGEGLAIETVNVDAVKVEIFRVSDRILARRDISAGEVMGEGDYGYEYSNVATEVRSEVWSGNLAVNNIPNTSSTTVLPINKLVGPLKAGAYIVKITRQVKGDVRNPARAWRWIISTDLALTSYQGKAGLDISVRSIDSAKTLSHVRVDLIANNNEILASTKSNASGHVHFDQAILRGRGATSPRMVMAYGQDGDFAVLDFNRSPLDLSAFAIGGRVQSTQIDAYLHTDRGVYRPGETVHLTSHIRDQLAKAVTGRSGSVRFVKPNGMEFLKTRFSPDDLKMGGVLSQSFTTPKSAPRGMWKAMMSIDGMGRVGKVEFAVEDFVPQKLRVLAKIDKSTMRHDEIRPFNVEAQFLYGANGKGLEAEAEARLRVDPAPFKGYEAYQFGRADEDFKEVFKELGSGVTDGDGILELGLSFKDENIVTSLPLRALITFGVAEPGGRYVKNSVRIPVRTQEHYIGLKPSFDRRAPRRKPFQIKIIALDNMGQTISLKGAKWTLVEEDWHYNWYRRNGRWKYRREVSDLMISSKLVDIGKDGFDFETTLDWGDYRLIVQSADGDTVSSTQFGVGWSGSNSSDAPDQISVGVPSDPVKQGDKVTLNIKAPYAGYGELVLANDRVHSIKTVKIPEGGSQISIKIDEDMGAGFYAMLSLYTPRDQNSRPVPRRAVGIGYIEIDRNNQKLDVQIQSKDKLRPRKKHKFVIKIENVPTSEKAYLSLAAVDEGILQITKFKSPDPQKFYFGKKALNVDIRDDYSRLLNPNLGQAAIAKSGGDSLGGEGLTATPQKTVSLFSGSVLVRGGKAVVEFDLPDFNGELRLMAQAWSASAMGQDVKAVKVRDAVPTILSLPRFMAPGDRAQVSLSLDNVEGAQGKYGYELSSNNGLVFDKTERGNQFVQLAVGERQTKTTFIKANGIGVNQIDLSIRGPKKYGVNSQFDLQTRSAFFPYTQTTMVQMQAGEIYTPSATLLRKIEPSTARVDISFSALAGIDPTGYLQSLARYPYGCTEQTVSTAMPLLYSDEIGSNLSLSDNKNRVKQRQKIQASIERILNRQGTDGAIGLWRVGDEYASPWIGVYATDFLIRAKSQNYVVNDKSLELSFKALKKLTRMERYTGLKYHWRYRNDNYQMRKSRRAHAAAYAFYVLADQGRAQLSDLRYFHDHHSKHLKTSLSHAHIGAALWLMNDKTRARTAFDKAYDRIDYRSRKNYYQSPLRDLAAMIDVVHRVGFDELNASLIPKLSDTIDKPETLNTQEKAHLIMAIRAMMKTAPSINVKAQNAVLSSHKSVRSTSISPENLLNAKKISFTNRAKNPVWRTVSVTGAPLSSPLPLSKKLNASKTIYSMSGKEIDSDQFEHGQKYIVKLSVESQTRQSRQLVLADLLPAGMEVEAILRPKDGARQDGHEGAFSWLGELDHLQMVESRDDRVIAVATTWRTEPARMAYIVRATTQGNFVWPGLVVQDMYKANHMARTKTRRAVIGRDTQG